MNNDWTNGNPNDRTGLTLKDLEDWVKDIFADGDVPKLITVGDFGKEQGRKREEEREEELKRD